MRCHTACGCGLCQKVSVCCAVPTTAHTCTPKASCQPDGLHPPAHLRRGAAWHAGGPIARVIPTQARRGFCLDCAHMAKAFARPAYPAPQRVNSFAPMLADWLPVRGRTTARVLPVRMPLPHAVARLLRRHQIAQSGAVGSAARWVHHIVHLNTSECAHWWVTRRHRPALGRRRRPRGVRHRRESTRRPCHNMVDAVRATDHFNSQVGNHLPRFGTRDATMPRPAIKRGKCHVWTPRPSRRHSQGEAQALISISLLQTSIAIDRSDKARAADG
jgi:hypothetical protein